MKRIVLFLLTNIAIMVVLMVVVNLLGVGHYITSEGLDLRALLVFSAVFGFGGAFISLFLSKWMVKRAYGVEVIETPRNAREATYMQTVYRLAKRAGIKRPEVGVYPSPEVNAFATGASRDSALIAVSTGLLDEMSQDELEGVIGHEICHAANGDMVTLTLIQGVVNTFVYFLAEVAAFFIDRVVLKNEEGRGIGYFLTSILFQVILGILASAIVMYFSRVREFAADAGSAEITSREKMIAALRKLQRVQERNAVIEEEQQLQPELTAMKISSGQALMKLFASHPSLESRIEALRNI